MKKKLNFSTLFSAIHLIFFLSILCFLTIYLSITILAIPAITSVFITGKEVIYKKYDIYESVFKSFFKNLKKELRMMRYFPVQFIAALQFVGLYSAKKAEMTYLLVPLLCIAALLITIIIYTIAFHVFYKELPSILDATIGMFYRIQYFLIIWVCILILVYFFNIKVAIALVLIGALALLLFEVIAFIGVTAYKRLNKELTDEEIEYFGEDTIKKF